MKTLRLILVAAVAFCFISSPAHAQAINAKGSCKADIEKFCKDIRPGQGRIVKCMQQHEAELSAACKDQVAQARERNNEFAKACKPDVEKFCKDVQPGQGRIISCLKQHQPDLSADCATHFKR
jgi:hypothetical protein